MVVPGTLLMLRISFQLSVITKLKVPASGDTAVPAQVSGSTVYVAVTFRWMGGPPFNEHGVCSVKIPFAARREEADRGVWQTVGSRPDPSSKLDGVAAFEHGFRTVARAGLALTALSARRRDTARTRESYSQDE